MLISGIIVFLGLSLLILIHEAGHFVAAKSAGLLVEEFGFGFPPRLWAKKIGETRYSINWLPFGGFVKIFGESKEQMMVNVGDGERQDNMTTRHSEWSEESNTNRSFGVPSAPAEAMADRQDDLSHRNDNRARSFSHQSAWRRFIILVAGAAMNVLLGWLLVSFVFLIGAPQAVIITGTSPDSPAAVAGFQIGDRLKDFRDSKSFVAAVDASRGKELPLVVIRKGEELTIKVTPRVSPPAGQGAIGVMFQEAGFARLSFFKAFWEGAKTSVTTMAAIITSFGALLISIFTTGAVPTAVVGPVGIFGVAGEVGSIGLIYLIQLIGLISLNLAVLNLIPFPALDGGRVLFLVIEKIKGSPLSARKELIANLVGFGLLLLLMFAVTARDIIRLL